MKIIEQSYDIISFPDNIVEMIEKVARTCYKSEDKIKDGSAEKLVKMLIVKGHEAMLEFGDITVKFITNRGILAEITRHRVCSFAVESTRYVKYDNDMEFIKPVWWNKTINIQRMYWMDAMSNAEVAYSELIKSGWKAQQAREVLPNSLKTEINVKANIREWRHIFRLRCSKAAHPQIRKLMIPLLMECHKRCSILFEDIVKELALGTQ